MSTTTTNTAPRVRVVKPGSIFDGQEGVIEGEFILSVPDQIVGVRFPTSGWLSYYHLRDLARLAEVPV